MSTSAYIRQSAAILKHRGYGVSTYILDYNSLALLQISLNSDFLTSIRSLFTGNPYEQIYSLRLYPMNVRTYFQNNTGQLSNTIKVGETTLASNIPNYALNDNFDQYCIRTIETSDTFTRKFNDFRDVCACQYSLYLPYYGVYTFDAKELHANNYAYAVVYQLDLITGTCTIKIGHSSAFTELYDTLEFKLGCDLPINATDRTNQILGTISIATSVASAIVGGIGAGSVGSATSGFDAAMQGIKYGDRAVSEVKQLQPKHYHKTGDSVFNNIINSDCLHEIQIWENDHYSSSTQLNEFIKENGIPTQQFCTLSDLTSNTSDTYKYAEFGIHPHTLEELTSGCRITATELQELVDILNNGVYFL